MRNFKLLPPALYYLFLVFVCKGNKFICCTQIILLKSLCFYLLLTFINKYIYILNTILQIKVLPHLIIYRAIVRGSRGGCPPWCPRGVLVVAGGWWLVSGVLVVAALPGVLVVAGGASLATSPAYSQPDTLAGARKAPQCGGALACESKLQGKFAGCDCSNYQLFRFSFRDGFYRLAFQLSL